jgi:hypothetical protein
MPAIATQATAGTKVTAGTPTTPEPPAIVGRPATVRTSGNSETTVLESQGHLYPLGERRDKHVAGGARTSAPLHRRRTLYLKSYLDSLYAGYSEPLLGRHQ